MNTFEILSLFKMVVSPCEKMQLLRESYSQIYSYTLRQQPMVKLFQDVVTIRLRSFFTSTLHAASTFSRIIIYWSEIIHDDEMLLNEERTVN